MTPERLATARATWLAAGLPAATFDAEYAAGEAAPTTTAEPSQTPAQEPAVVDTTGRAYQPEAYRLDMHALGLAGQPIEAQMEAKTTWSEFMSAGDVDPLV